MTIIMTTELAQPQNFLDRVAVWCAKYLIFAFGGLYVLSSVGTPYGVLKSALTGLFMAFVAWAIAFVLQLVIRRPRPFDEGKRPLMQMLWETPSFPSAHTAISFSIVSLFVRAGDWRLAVAFAILATIVAWSRVRVRVHHVSDTIAGAGIGLAAVPVGHALAELAFNVSI